MKANEKICREIADFIRDTLQMELLNQGHVASEALFNSIECVTRKTLSAFDFTAQSVYYAQFVNDGRKKGVKGIPLGTLLNWIRLRKFELHGKKEASVAFAIQNSIKQKGIKASRFIDKSIAKIDRSSRLDNMVEQLMEDFIEEQIIRIFNKMTYGGRD